MKRAYRVSPTGSFPNATTVKVLSNFSLTSSLDLRLNLTQSYSLTKLVCQVVPVDGIEPPYPAYKAGPLTIKDKRAH